ncbi:MAG: phage shock protein operon transcriptional activator [Alphaproteobacteria bacterium]|nr:MAG: phage shock protein operon transcriptional activator [Alphaproteobacteria bacterium]
MEITILGAAPAFLDLMDRVSAVAPLDRPVLVVGERGTGKELIAARLHYLSRRWEEAFIKLNCAALPESLLEAELFGVEPGAFTGAVRRRRGRFELADRGSLFLDEIGTLSPAAQEKLLRIIEYGTFERLGGSETLEVNVRVIGATNVDLPALAEEGRFRADLLDRLAFDVLTVPPLRERGEDIPLLADHFGRGMARELGWPAFPGFSDKALADLAAWRWPGNVRELKNVAERAVYRWPEPGRPIDRVDFDPFDSPWRPRPEPAAERAAAAGAPDGKERAIALPDPPYDFRATMATIEKRLLAEALAAHRHHQRSTAEALGLSYDQLRHAAKKHGLL